MGNKKTNLEDELLYSLPDYVNGKVYDESLKSEIEKKIKTDAEFRNEYLSVRNAFQFVKDSSFEEPPEHYFNNLVPRLNERIERSRSVSAIDFRFILHLWRYIVPALTVILVIVIVAIPRKDKNELIQNGNKDTQSVVTFTDDSPLEPASVDNDAEETDITETPDAVGIINNPVTIKYTPDKKETAIENKNVIVNITDLIQDTEENAAEESDEYNYESDFKNLTPSEQNEVLANLSKTKF
ncbi:MAG: hypothetical protein PHN88_05630 [Ignavibacteria bacterium]|nr:hypothetical protein [Ignavibacteria bacterium]